MIVCGLAAGAPVERIVGRAVVGLFAGAALGALAAAVGLIVVRDHLESLETDHREANDSQEPVVDATGNGSVSKA
jgi:hypothetical protein